MKKYKILILLFLTSAVQVGCGLFFPYYTGVAVDFVVAEGKVDFASLSRIIGLLVACLLVNGAVGYGVKLLTNRLSFRYAKELRKELFHKLQVLPLLKMDTLKTGDILSRTMNDVTAVCDGLLLGSAELMSAILTIIGVLIILFSKSVGCGILLVIMTPISAFVAWFISNKTKFYFKRQAEQKSSVLTFSEEYVPNGQLIQSFGQEERMKDKFEGLSRDLQKTSCNATFFSSLVNPSTRFVNNLIYAVIALYGGFVCIEGGISVGTLTAFLSYANQYTKPFNQLADIWTELQNAKVCYHRIDQFLKLEEEPERKTENLQLSGQVDFDNISFSYDGEHYPIRNLSLSLKPGEQIAVIGPTGCGKTTLINLLMGFYPLKDGVIRLDGMTMADYSPESYRKQIGMVLQDTWLKSGTVRENLLLGNPDISTEEMVEICKKARCHRFISQMEKGYDTPIGSALSEGQKQLLCIARVMIANPKILILDEATSALDEETEANVQMALNEMMKGKTSFIVAHRLSTIRSANRVLRFTGGGNFEIITQN